MIAAAATSRRQTRFFDRGSLRKWKVIMGTLNTRAGNTGSTIGKIVMALVCATMIGGVFVAPAFSDDHGRREGDQKHRRYRQSRRAYQPPPRHYYYSEPVYVPPPVVYAPAPYRSPGISIVFPLY
jgi:hypothetical protein